MSFPSPPPFSLSVPSVADVSSSQTRQGPLRSPGSLSRGEGQRQRQRQRQTHGQPQQHLDNAAASAFVSVSPTASAVSFARRWHTYGHEESLD